LNLTFLLNRIKNVLKVIGIRFQIKRVDNTKTMKLNINDQNEVGGEWESVENTWDMVTSRRLHVNFILDCCNE